MFRIVLYRWVLFSGSVTFQITCAILMVEFNIKENRICLTQLQNSPNNALQDIVGIYFKLPKLIRVIMGNLIKAKWRLYLIRTGSSCFKLVGSIYSRLATHFATLKGPAKNIGQPSAIYTTTWLYSARVIISPGLGGIIRLAGGISSCKWGSTN